MSFFTTTLLGIAMGILAIALIYTLIVARDRKVLNSELDSQIPQPVQEHAYIRNPIFLTYAIFFTLVILIIVFFSLYSNW